MNKNEIIQQSPTDWKYYLLTTIMVIAFVTIIYLMFWNNNMKPPSHSRLGMVLFCIGLTLTFLPLFLIALGIVGDQVTTHKLGSQYSQFFGGTETITKDSDKSSKSGKPNSPQVLGSFKANHADTQTWLSPDSSKAGPVSAATNDYFSNQELIQFPGGQQGIGVAFKDQSGNDAAGPHQCVQPAWSNNMPGFQTSSDGKSSTPAPNQLDGNSKYPEIWQYHDLDRTPSTAVNAKFSNDAYGHRQATVTISNLSLYVGAEVDSKGNIVLGNKPLTGFPSSMADVKLVRLNAKLKITTSGTAPDYQYHTDLIVWGSGIPQDHPLVWRDVHDNVLTTLMTKGLKGQFPDMVEQDLPGIFTLYVDPYIKNLQASPNDGDPHQLQEGKDVYTTQDKEGALSMQYQQATRWMSRYFYKEDGNGGAQYTPVAESTGTNGANVNKFYGVQNPMLNGQPLGTDDLKSDSKTPLVISGPQFSNLDQNTQKALQSIFGINSNEATAHGLKLTIRAGPALAAKVTAIQQSDTSAGNYIPLIHHYQFIITQTDSSNNPHIVYLDFKKHGLDWTVCISSDPTNTTYVELSDASVTSVLNPIGEAMGLLKSDGTSNPDSDPTKYTHDGNFYLVLQGMMFMNSAQQSLKAAGSQTLAHKEILGRKETDSTYYIKGTLNPIGFNAGEGQLANGVIDDKGKIITDAKSSGTTYSQEQRWSVLPYVEYAGGNVAHLVNSGNNDSQVDHTLSMSIDKKSKNAAKTVKGSYSGTGPIGGNDYMLSDSKIQHNQADTVNNQDTAVAGTYVPGDRTAKETALKHNRIMYKGFVITSAAGGNPDWAFVPAQVYQANGNGNGWTWTIQQRNGQPVLELKSTKANPVYGQLTDYSTGKTYKGDIIYHQFVNLNTGAVTISIKVKNPDTDKIVYTSPDYNLDPKNQVNADDKYHGDIWFHSMYKKLQRQAQLSGTKTTTTGNTGSTQQQIIDLVTKTPYSTVETAVNGIVKQTHPYSSPNQISKLTGEYINALQFYLAMYYNIPYDSLLFGGQAAHSIPTGSEIGTYMKLLTEDAFTKILAQYGIDIHSNSDPEFKNDTNPNTQDLASLHAEIKAGVTGFMQTHKGLIVLITKTSTMEQYMVYYPKITVATTKESNYLITLDHQARTDLNLVIFTGIICLLSSIIANVYDMQR